MVGTLDMAVNEVRFYDELAPALGGDVAPRAWYARAGCGARFLMVLEHLVAEGGRPYALADPCPIDHARTDRRIRQAAFDILGQLALRHGPRLGTPVEHAAGQPVPELFYSRGRHAALKLDRPEAGPAAKALVSALDGNADAFYRAFETGPLTLLHGDSHLGNTFSRADGRSGLLDWQVIWRGPGMREVTYWMVTGLEPGTRRAHERD
nr:phosphotransferase [Gordonia rubripertincta]MDG6782126.1 phosphotransferase [Gordonia rubripertincta]